MRHTFASPDVTRQTAIPDFNFKEIVMNEELQLEVVELGDAKVETKGAPDLPIPEENQVGVFRNLA